MIVPDHGFALTALTNSAGGPTLTQELFEDDWALRAFAGLDNLPAVPQVLSRRQLVPYEGRYAAEVIEPNGAVAKTIYELRGDSGHLRRSAESYLSQMAQCSGVAVCVCSPRARHGSVPLRRRLGSTTP
jgi:hypothetical protein